MEASTNMKPCLVTYNTFLQCAFETGDYNFAKKIFDNLKQKDIFSYSIQILFLLKKGGNFFFFIFIKLKYEI